jgi:DNA-binding protein HU-beta
MATTKRSTGSNGKSTASRSRSTSTQKSASRTQSAKAGSAKSKAASPKRRTTSAAAKTSRASTNGAKRTQSRASSSGTTQSRNSSRRGTSARSASAASSRNGGTAHTQDGMVGKLKQTGTAVLQVADKAGRPTVTVAAAVAGIAGGLALRQRHAAVPDGVAARSMAKLNDVDPKAVLEGLGKAAVQVSQRSKSVAKDLERVADQAERVGKILS